jgi:hypothetical protein
MLVITQSNQARRRQRFDWKYIFHLQGKFTFRVEGIFPFEMLVITQSNQARRRQRFDWKYISCLQGKFTLWLEGIFPFEMLIITQSNQARMRQRFDWKCISYLQGKLTLRFPFEMLVITQSYRTRSRHSFEWKYISHLTLRLDGICPFEMLVLRTCTPGCAGKSTALWLQATTNICCLHVYRSIFVLWCFCQYSLSLRGLKFRIWFTVLYDRDRIRSILWASSVPVNNNLLFVLRIE